ncbi:MAG: hypothetical protein LBF25_02820 [Puniceicoccales bacterium]|jgi:hypothetical protein|nr:hypothetical protein [Puniceicoccales bacterium]
MIAEIHGFNGIAPNLRVRLNKAKHSANEIKQYASKAYLHGVTNFATFSSNTTITSLLATNFFSLPKNFQFLATATKFFPLSKTRPSPAAIFDNGTILAWGLSMEKTTLLSSPQRLINMFDTAMEPPSRTSPVEPVISQVFTPFTSKIGTYNPLAGEVATTSGPAWSMLDIKKLIKTNFATRLQNDFI